MNTLALPSPFYTVDDTGLVYVHGNPTQADFEQAWSYLCHIRDILPKVMGNMLAHASARWGDTYTDELIEQSGRSYFTLAQYKSVYSRVPRQIQEQYPDVKHTALRIVAQLPAEKQPVILDRIESGDFDEPDPEYPDLDDKEKRIRAAVHQLKGEPAPKPPAPMTCPICGGNGWSREALHRIECPHTECGAHGDELLEKFAEALAAMREFALYGALDGIIEFVRPYKNGWIEEAE